MVNGAVDSQNEAVLKWGLGGGGGRRGESGWLLEQPSLPVIMMEREAEEDRLREEREREREQREREQLEHDILQAEMDELWKDKVRPRTMLYLIVGTSEARSRVEAQGVWFGV